MEEILASIRRIIESNEPGAGQSISSTLPPVYAEDEVDVDDEIHLTIDNDNVLKSAFDDRRSQADDTAAETQGRAAANTPAEEPKSMSLADVAARVRAASERNTAQLRDAPPQPRRPEIAIASVTPTVSNRTVELRSPTRADNVSSLSAQAAIVRTAPPVMPEQPLRDAATVYGGAASEPALTAAAALAETPLDELVAFAEPIMALVEMAKPEQPAAAAVAAAQPAQDHADPESFQSGNDRDLRALLSPEAGHQVSRSFGDLATAIDGGPRRSFDDIAQEMLRPMLQDWLDDNLPTLVERLVREEIERVARGPRR